MANIKTDSRLALQRALEQQLGRTPRTLEQQVAGTRPQPVRYPSAAGMEVNELGRPTQYPKPDGIKVQELFRNQAGEARSAARAAAVRPAPAAPAPGTAANPLVNDATQAVQKTVPAAGRLGKLRSLLSSAGAGMGMAQTAAVSELMKRNSEGGAVPDAFADKMDKITSSAPRSDWFEKLGGGRVPAAKPSPTAAKPVPAQAAGAQAQARKADGPQVSAPAPFDPMRPAGTGLSARTLLAGGGANGEDVTVANSELEAKTGGKLVADGILRTGNTFTNVVDGNRIGPKVGDNGQVDNVQDAVNRMNAAPARPAPSIVATLGGGQGSGNGVIDYFRNAGERKQQRAMQLQDSQNSAAMARQEANDRTQREVAGANNDQAMARTLLQEQGENARAQTAAAAKNQLSASDLLTAQRDQRQAVQNNRAVNQQQLEGLNITEADPKGVAGAAAQRQLLDRTARALGRGNSFLDMDPGDTADLLQAASLANKVAGTSGVFTRTSGVDPQDYVAYMPNQGGKGGFAIDPNNSGMVVGRDALGNEVWRATKATVQAKEPSMLQYLFNFRGFGQQQAPYASN